MSRRHPHALHALLALALLAGCADAPDATPSAELSDLEIAPYLKEGEAPDTGPWIDATDCDGEEMYPWYEDTDGDGFGGGDPIAFCEPPTPHHVPDGGDCDDHDPLIHPGAEEICDGIDNDCDGVTDLADAVGAETWWADFDGDGFGDPGKIAIACEQPDPSVPAGGEPDCDDDDPTAWPGGEEVCDGADNDCDGDIDDGPIGSRWYGDYDGDGYAGETYIAVACEAPDGFEDTPKDCDDLDAAVNPGAEEVCDGIDNDCDGDTDPPEAADAPLWWADFDGDGFGDPGKTAFACEQPLDSAPEGGEPDCDDGEPDNWPGNDEVCDGIDNDCDGEADEDSLDALNWFADHDGDGFGAPESGVASCEALADHVEDDTDCDDDDPDTNPDAEERCDGEDDDCDGAVDDDAEDADAWYRDDDGDGFGDDGDRVDGCEPPDGYAAEPGDCDDGDAAINPKSLEVCDGADNDCDGATDPDSAADAATWYRDDDGDGHGDAEGPLIACEPPPGFIADGSIDDGGPGDCDDGEPAAHPGGFEVCDGIDNDCDGATDPPEAAGALTWHSDGDGDGFGDPEATLTRCEQPPDHVEDASDCDDDDPTAHPGANERCDGDDEDCDPQIDEHPVDGSWWFDDSDGDSFGDPDEATFACAPTPDQVADDTDCDDSDPAVHPDAVERCGDGDENCSGDEDDAIDRTRWYHDGDGDGYGDLSDYVDDCYDPGPWVEGDEWDCDDDDSTIHPYAPESCDEVDEDCDYAVDEGECEGCGIEEWGGHEYRFCLGPLDWEEARDHCAEMGFRLARVSGSSEDDWIWDTLNDGYPLGYQSDLWWFGFNDRAVEGSWVWEGGGSTWYTNWHPGEPNNDYHGSPDEHCAHYNWFTDGTWNDYPCWDAAHYICEEN